MPLKFLKKCRQYNVTSKSLFVISVHHLLDTSTTVDCTISSESKGQECLDNVCQRLNLQEPEFFGLRYVVKGREDELKWIDLERSLSRQLEKYAASTKIYLRVRHYVDPSRRDDLTRYYYFLQLKSDIYEGKIICDIRTAILLALYCRQAEYDSHQNDKQTKDYLKKSLVLPRNLQGLANDDNLLDSLIMEVLQQNAGIQHLQQSQAEEMYIQCCQQLDGYGEERFHAKDTLGNDLLLGLAINGMVVMADNGRQYFPWKESQTVSIDKRTIKIEQNKTDGSIVGSFIFTDAETARYFWKLCITQHKFFKRYIDEEAASSMGDAESANGNSGVTGSVLAGGMETYAYGDFNDSREDLLLEQQQRAIYNPNAMSSGGGGGGVGLTNINPEFMSAPALHHGLLASTHASNALMSSNISLAASHQSGGGGGGGIAGGGANGGMHSHSVGAIAPSWLTKEYGHDYASTQHLSNSMLDTRLQQSTSCLDLTNNNGNNIGGVGGSNFHSSSNNIVHGHLGGSVTNNSSNVALHSVDAHERERLKAMLPTYRPAPDYETAVQLKYRTPSSELHHPQMNNYVNYQPQSAVGVGATPTAGGAIYYAGSQPDVHNAAAIYGDGVLLSQLAPHRYPDVAQPAAAAMHAQHHHLSVAGVTMAPGGHSNSTSSGGGAYIDLGHRLQMIRSKPPPPYPVNRLNSSSTPDLAVATHRPLMGFRAYVSGSSPDLVSNRNLLNSQYPYGSSVGANIGNASQTVGGMVAAATNHALIHPHSSSYMSSGGHMGHSQSYLPHGTFENLNMIEEQPSILSQLRQECLFVPHNTHSYNEQHSPTLTNNANSNNTNNVYRPTPPQQVQSQQQQKTHQSPQQSQPHAQQKQLQNSQTTIASLQRNTLNGSIEPIYENVPHARYVAAEPTVQRSVEQRSSGSSATSESMRNRTASIQSAPGGMNGTTQQQMPPVPAARHHHHLQQQQQQEHQKALQQQAQQQSLQQQQQQQVLLQQQAHALSQQQQQVHAQQQAEAETTANAAALNMHKYVERAASTDRQFLEPMPAQRAARAASAAPAVGHNNSNNQQTMKQTPPPRHHHTHAQKAQLIQTNSSASTVDVAAATTANKAPKNNIGMRAQTSPPEHNDCTDSMLLSAQHQFSAMNISTLPSNASASAATTLKHSSPNHQHQHQHHRSHNASMLDTTANSSSTTTTNSFNTTNSSSTSGKEGKRKKIWNILGRSKTPDKQKSATLGREKASSSSALKTAAKIKLAQDDLNLMHRWSTGVPRLQPISGQYSKEKLCPILNEKLNDPQLFIEFESIPKRREMARYDCALMEENAMKNSDPNFLPYDDNRVCITPTMENRTGYVNASRISATVGTKQRFYIIAQSPQEELTTRIFWQCVWEADVYLIVQLSEGLNYMPPNSNQRLEFGQFQVYQEFSQTTDRCITSKLRLFHIQSRRYRSVWHLNYTNWGEQNCPREVNHFLDFLEELNSVRMASINEVPPGHNTNPPVLIHCLEGGGRSGVTLTADLLLYTLDHNEDLDIPRVIGQLRHQRDSIIPSLAQYKFIYSLLITYLKRTRLI